MCTLSWFHRGKNYSLFFNRDESIQRQRARVPALYNNEGVRFIMPLDPGGGGTWLAVNEFGLSVALLNHYQGRLPKGRLRSRGEIVKTLAISENYFEANKRLQAFSLQKYAPFSLFVFERAEQREVSGLRWDGKQLNECEVQSPFFSSAIDLSDVVESRRKIFSGALQDVHQDNAVFEKIHRSHLPEKSQLSICMHRADANTVSFSKVEVDETGLRFYYCDGPPCENPIELAAELDAR